MKRKRDTQISDIYSKRNEMIERFRSFIDKLDDTYIEGNLTKQSYLNHARDYAKKISKEYVVYGFGSSGSYRRQDIHINIKSIYSQFPHLLIDNLDKYLYNLTHSTYNESQLVDAAKKWFSMITEFKTRSLENSLVSTEKMVQSFTKNQVVTDKIMFRVMTELN